VALNHRGSDDQYPQRAATGGALHSSRCALLAIASTLLLRARAVLIQALTAGEKRRWPHHRASGIFGISVWRDSGNKRRCGERKLA